MKRKTKKTAAKPRVKSAKQMVVQDALQTTWLLKGTLKNAQLSYLRVGKLLAQVREKKMYAALGHPNIEDYAEKRLQLGRSSLYKYLQVYDWVSSNHPEWLEKKPQGFIPELYDVADLMWIEEELSKTNISSSRRAALEELKKKALAGTLSQQELRKFRSADTRVESSLKNYLSKLRNLRMRGSQLASMPQEAITHIDAAIAIIKNAGALPSKLG
jgi:hypothetical protein